VQEEEAVFEQIDQDEYEKIQDARKNDNFIVDDDGFGYKDTGGEIWEYEDHHNKAAQGKKKRQITQAVSKDSILTRN
jgi:DNA polymerase alpha subunit A